MWIVIYIDAEQLYLDKFMPSIGVMVNPIIYGIMNQQYRNAYVTILTCKCQKTTRNSREISSHSVSHRVWNKYNFMTYIPNGFHVSCRSIVRTKYMYSNGMLFFIDMCWSCCWKIIRKILLLTMNRYEIKQWEKVVYYRPWNSLK